MLGFNALSEAPLSALPDAGGSTNVTASPGTGSLTLTGFAPTVSATQSATASPGTGALVITGYAPSVTVPTSVTVTPGTGALVLTGYAPTVSEGGQRSQDFRNVLDGPGERYWLDKKKRDKDEKKKREEELLAALEAELRQAEADAEAVKKPRTRKKAIPQVEAQPVADVVVRKQRATSKRKVADETHELIRAKTIAIEADTVAAAEAEARAIQFDEEAAIILLLAA